MKISAIKPYEKNAKRHPTKQVRQVAESIKAFGFNQPIVVDKDGVIIVGHGRYEAAKHLGLKDVPVIKVDLTPEQANAYRLADNKLNESEWDMKLAVDELRGFSKEMFDLTGFDADLLINPDEKDDEIPENVPARSKLGDLYELGDHRVLCGDSTQAEAVSRLINGLKVNMVFTDPPYGVNYVSRVDKSRRKNWGGIKNDDLKDKDLQRFLQATVPLHFRCPQYVCCNWQSVKDFFEALGIPSSLIVWDKKSIGLGANYRSQHEFILFYGKLNHRRESNVWGMKRDNLGDYKHPTQKPVELIVRALVNSSARGGGYL